MWKLDLSRERVLPTLDLAPQQRAIVLVEDGEVDLQTGDRRVRMDAGPFKVDETYESVIHLSKKGTGGGLLDNVLRIFSGD